MYADFNTEVTVKGTADELAAIGAVLWEAKDNEIEITLNSINIGSWYKSIFAIEKEEFLSIVSSADGEFTVEAEGPYGRFGDLAEVELFTDMANAAPDAYFSGEIHGVSDGSGEYMDAYATLEDRKLSLHFENTSVSCENEDRENASGHRFCISEKLKYFKNRDSLINELKCSKAEVEESVSDKTDYLICRDPKENNTLTEAAREHGAEIISELDFIWRFNIYPDMFDETDLEEYREETKEEYDEVYVYDPETREFVDEDDLEN